MGKETNKDRFKQGGWGAKSTRKAGSQLDQGEGRAKSTRSAGSHLDQGEGRAKATDTGGSHLDPHPALTDKTADKQGGTIRGHDRVNPNAGKSKSGSKFDQHPSLKR